MEISGISGGFMNSGEQEFVSLTDEQKTTVQEILSKYDPENFSREDMDAFLQELREAGVPKSGDVIKIMDEAGFKPAGPPPPPPGGMPEMTEEDSELKEQLLELLEQFKSGALNEDQLVSGLDELLQNFGSTSGAIFDGTA